VAENENTGQTSKKGGVNKKVIVAVAAVIIVTVIVIVALLILLRKEEPEEKVRKAVLTPEDAQEVLNDMLSSNNSDAPDRYTVMQNPEWHFKNGQTESYDAYVENSTENETPVYFDVVLDDTGEMVYSSPVLLVGAKISNFKLDVSLAKGTYPCTVIYTLVDDEQNALTTVRIGHTIIIEN
jgi:hypothetical protein